MMFAMRRVLRSAAIVAIEIAACLAALAAWALMASGALAEDRPPAPPLTVPFEVAWGEITLVEGRFAFEESDGGYVINGAGETKGPLNWMSRWRGEFSASGEMDGAVRAATLFQTRSEGSRGRRETMVRYEDGRPIEASVSSARDATQELTPVDPADNRDVSDALSFFASAIDVVRQSDGADCAYQGRVWDGVRLFEMTVETLGPGVAPSDRPWSYGGPTLRCQLFFNRLGGFPAERRWGSSESDITRIIHFAAIGDAWMPVRVEISAPVADVVARVRLDEATAPQIEAVR